MGLDIIYYLFILLFSAVLSRIILFRAIPSYHLYFFKIKWDFKTARYFSLLFISTGAIFITASFSFNYLEKKFETKANEKSNDILIYANLNEKKEKVAKILGTELQKDTIINYIQSYYDAYCVNDSVKLDNFYSFPLEKFFTFSPANKKVVHKWANYDHRHHKYDDCKISKDNTTIVNNKDTTEVSIQLSKSTAEIKYYTIIKLDKNKKIFWIASTILTPYYDKNDSIQKAISQIKKESKMN